MAPPLRNYVRPLRRHAGLSQEELAHLLDISNSGFLSRLEKFERGVSLDLALLLALVLGKPVEEVFAGKASELAASLEGRLAPHLDVIDADAKEGLLALLERLQATPEHRHRLLGLGVRAGALHFVVLEEGDRLIDWGCLGTRLLRCREAQRHARVLWDRFESDAVVIEDPAAGEHTRRRGPAQMLTSLRRFAEKTGQACVPLSRMAMVRALEQEGCSTLEQRAWHLASLFPILQKRLPPPREPWMSEDARIGLFDTLAFTKVAMDKHLDQAHA